MLKFIARVCMTAFALVLVALWVPLAGLELFFGWCSGKPFEDVKADLLFRFAVLVDDMIRAIRDPFGEVT